jgi:hypothetical protein
LPVTFNKHNWKIIIVRFEGFYFPVVEGDLMKKMAGRTKRAVRGRVRFLGIHFSLEGCSVAEKSLEKFLACTVRLYLAKGK